MRGDAYANKQIAELTAALLSIRDLSSDTRRLERTAQRLVETGRFPDAMEVFRQVARRLDRQAKAAAVAAAASLVAAAYCEYRGKTVRTGTGDRALDERLRPPRRRESATVAGSGGARTRKSIGRRGSSR